MAGPRNQHGVNDMTDCYRTFDGLRYSGWCACPSPARKKAYRAAGVRCRQVAGELFVCDEDKARAIEVDGQIGPDA